MMWRILFALILLVVCWTGAGAGPLEDADSALERGDFTLAVRLFRPFTEQGDARAQSNLGRFYYYMRRGVPKDTQEAVRKWRQAAKSGDEEASLYLGTMYEKGQGIPQDNVLAYMWYAVAAAILSGEDAKVAKRLQDHVASRMTAKQIETAQEMARRCQDTKFKDCD
jgi:TPR repeat protein